jgi:hypothetical protein
MHGAFARNMQDYPLSVKTPVMGGSFAHLWVKDMALYDVNENGRGGMQNGSDS